MYENIGKRYFLLYRKYCVALKRKSRVSYRVKSPPGDRTAAER